MSRTKRVFVLTLQVLAAGLGCPSRGLLRRQRALDHARPGRHRRRYHGQRAARPRAAAAPAGRPPAAAPAGGTGGGATGGGGSGGGGGGGSFTPLCSAVPAHAGRRRADQGRRVHARAIRSFATRRAARRASASNRRLAPEALYVEQSGCSFPDNMDYACYKIPGDREHDLSGHGPAGVPELRRRRVHTLQRRRTLRRFGGCAEGRLLRLPQGRQRRHAQVELRELDGLALPCWQGMLSEPT